MIKNPCPECDHGIDSTDLTRRHLTTCSLATPEEVRAMLNYYVKAYQKEFARHHAEMLKAMHNAERWHGKYMMVKHENNKLRRKLYTNRPPKNIIRHARALEATARKLIDYYDDPENTPGA